VSPLNGKLIVERIADEAAPGNRSLQSLFPHYGVDLKLASSLQGVQNERAISFGSSASKAATSA
jgi:hypothetical protein